MDSISMESSSALDTGESVRYVNRAQAPAEPNNKSNNFMISDRSSQIMDPLAFVRTHSLENILVDYEKTLTTHNTVEQWQLLSHRLANDLKAKIYQLENNRSKLDSMKMLWQNDIKDCQIECEKQIEKKNKEIAKLQDAIQKKEDEHSKKLRQIREKLKTTEK